MINETLSLGECPIIKPEGIYYGGRRVIALDPNLSGVGLGDPGDLLAYRQEWEPFIAAHLALWRDLNGWFESNAAAQKCPAGVPTSGLKNLDEFCAALVITRMRVGNNSGDGILPQWNAWKDKSSADMVAGASTMLAWHQEVVMRVGGQYKTELLDLARRWGLSPPQLPDLPSFSLQQQIIARIQGAYITTKGVLQLIGYGVGEALSMASDVTQATAQGLVDTAKALPKTAKWVGIAAVVAVVVVGGALVVYYVPKHRTQTPSTT